MLKANLQSVTLPDGDVVQISQAPEKWWSEQNGAGYVSPELLAPDPDQPRKRMSKTKLVELETSIAACGVLEQITVTPRALAPWVRVLPEHGTLPFVIVSGHRRATCAKKVGLLAVPIRVRVFKSEEDHRTNGGVLNACRDDLSELEQGFEFLRERKTRKTFAQIASAHGINTLTVQNRINLTKLHPELFPLLDADPRTGKRVLPIYPASILGGIVGPTEKELSDMAEQFDDIVDVHKATGLKSFEGLGDDDRRFAMQKILVAVIVIRKLNSVRAAEFIRDRTLVFERASGGQAKTERYQPARRKEVLLNLIKEVTGSAIIDWSPDEFRRIYALSSREDLDDVMTRLQGAVDVLTGTMKVLARVRESKRSTSPEVLSLVNRTRTSLVR